MISNAQEQAIKIEQLKGEWHQERAQLQMNIVTANSELRNIEKKIAELDQRKRELNAEIFRSEEQLNESEKHYALLIRACQGLYEDAQKRVSQEPLISDTKTLK